MFEWSWVRIPAPIYLMDSFSQWCVVKIELFVWKRLKIYKKEAGVGPFKKQWSWILWIFVGWCLSLLFQSSVCWLTKNVSRGQWLWCSYRSSNPAIANFYSTYLLLTVCRKDEITEKEAGNGPFTKECAEIVRIVYVCNWEIYRRHFDCFIAYPVLVSRVDNGQYMNSQCL